MTLSPWKDLVLFFNFLHSGLAVHADVVSTDLQLHPLVLANKNCLKWGTEGSSVSLQWKNSCVSTLGLGNAMGFTLLFAREDL